VPPRSRLLPGHRIREGGHILGTHKRRVERLGQHRQEGAVRSVLVHQRIPARVGHRRRRGGRRRRVVDDEPRLVLPVGGVPIGVRHGPHDRGAGRGLLRGMEHGRNVRPRQSQPPPLRGNGAGVRGPGVRSFQGLDRNDVHRGVRSLRLPAGLRVMPLRGGMPPRRAVGTDRRDKVRSQR